MIREHDIYRMWIDGKDYGTAGGRAATLVREAVSLRDPMSIFRMEPVEDDAPVFLPKLPAITITWPGNEHRGPQGRVGDGPIENLCYNCGRTRKEHVDGKCPATKEVTTT